MLSRKIKLEYLLIIYGILQFVFAISAIATEKRMLIVVFFALVGFLNAGLFPSILALGSKYYENNKGFALSILTAFVGVGGLVGTVLVSILYESYSLRIGLIYVSSIVLGVSVIMMIYLFFYNKFQMIRQRVRLDNLLI
jgi:MFS family permease